MFDENCLIILVLNFNTSGCLQSNSHSSVAENSSLGGSDAVAMDVLWAVNS